MIIMRVKYSNDMLKTTHLYFSTVVCSNRVGTASSVNFNFLFFIQMRRQYVFLINHKESILKMILAYPSMCGRLMDKFKFW